MALSRSSSYFISKPQVYLLDSPAGRDKKNHLLLGDWLRVLEADAGSDWARVRCRNTEGWLRLEDFSERRALEVNFVDIGQGDGCHIVTPDDDIILIDAGVGSNMNRFLSWRYNLRRRNVAGAPDFDPDKSDREPWLIDHVIISHPDNDHYYGLRDVFANPKLAFKTVYHNGIVERPDEPAQEGLEYPDDLGGYVRHDQRKYLWDMIDTSTKMQQLIRKHSRTRKQFLSTVRACVENSPGVTFKAVSVAMDSLARKSFLGPFDNGAELKLQVLGPITESVEHEGTVKQCLRKLGSEGITKNGHSQILKLAYGKLSLMLGGDLNTQAQDFLLRAYTSLDANASDLENQVRALEALGGSRTAEETGQLQVARSQLDLMVAEARAVFQADVTKACHHGSSHFTDTFLRAINPIATVISSGDNESHSHPRPDALGAFGKYGRGRRPLIFSTELARSTREFTLIARYLDTLRDFQRRIESAENERDRKQLEQELENTRDRNVAVYGMITLRALDDQLVMAQKLEQPRKSGTKWDLHELAYNSNTRQFEAVAH